MTPPEERILAIIRKLRTHSAHLRGKALWSDMDPALARAAETKHPFELTVPEYRHLAWHAFCWDTQDPETIRYFLPSLFDDLIFAPGDLVVPPEMLICGLNGSGWLRWPEKYRGPVAEFLAAWWALTLGTPLDERGNADEVLPLILMAGVDAALLLQEWLDDDTDTAVGQLAHFVVEHERAVAPNEWQMRVPEPALTQVRTFVFSPEVRRKLESAIVRPDCERWLERIQWALDRLEMRDCGAA